MSESWSELEMCPDGELTLTLPAYLVQSTCEASQLVGKAQGNLSMKLSAPPLFSFETVVSDGATLPEDLNLISSTTLGGV